jgi:hypothetical protein
MLNNGLNELFRNANISDPITRPACQARCNVFAFEVGGSVAQPRWVDILQHVDVDYCIEVIRDFAGYQGYGAAPRANVKRGSSRAEGIL